MKEIVEWLIGMEHRAGEMYKESAGLFRKDKPLAQFLRHAAQDEAWHYIVMGSAADFMTREPLTPSNLVLDTANKSRLEDLCHKIEEKIANETLTKEALIDFIVTIELSEWNYFFLYVVNALREKRGEFEYAASKIECHKKYIERFIEKLPNNRPYIKKLRQLPKVWNCRILIIEDYKPLRTLLSHVLSTEGLVETAASSEAGFKRIQEHYYDIILLNDFMPGMSGMELYKKAVQRDPLIAKRFVFLVDVMTPGSLDFMKKNKLRYLTKPFPVHEVKDAIHQVLSATPDRKQISIFRSSFKK